jgi:hypothetical protein
MTSEERQKIKARAESSYDFDLDFFFTAMTKDIDIIHESEGTKYRIEMAKKSNDLIVNAKADILSLVAEVERLEATLAYYENPALYTTDPRYGVSEAVRDGGDTARRALKSGDK